MHTEPEGAVAGPPALLSSGQARKVYRHLGWALSLISRYEAAATRKLITMADFHKAEAVFEFGCGTGHFAEQLLVGHLPPKARYKGVDITPAMVTLTRQRLCEFIELEFPVSGPRVAVEQSDGGPPTAEVAGSYDRFVSNFVLDILPETAIAEVLAEAHRMLSVDGLLCLATLSPGSRRSGRVAMRLWQSIYRIRPELLGGCRPLALQALLSSDHWLIVHQETVQPFAIPLEIVVARKLAP